MEDDHETTTAKYLEYRLATQGSWKILDIDYQQRYAQIIEALATSTRVKTFSIRCDQCEGVTDADLFMLAEAIESNDSLETFAIGCNRQTQVAPLEWAALLTFIRSHPDLKHLSLSNDHLTEKQILELIDTLKEVTALNFLNLGGDNNNSSVSLMAIAKFAANCPTLTHLEFNDELWTEEMLEPIFAIIQKSTSLTAIGPHYFSHCNEFIRRNQNARLGPTEKIVPMTNSPQPPAAPDPVLLSDLTHEPTIKLLSSDTLRSVFWQLNIKSVVSFRLVDKQFFSFTKHNSFWRGYYTTHFASVPDDVLMLTDLTYGLKLATSSLASEVLRRSPIWEEIFITSFLTRTVSASDYPINNGLPFLASVYRQYPQLIGTANSTDSFTSLPPERHFPETKDAPYTSTWFLTFANDSALYHLGFEKLADGQYNGILLLTPDFSAAFSERFKHLEYIFEWFAAKNETEFSEKIKPLCEVFLAARDNENNRGTVSAPYYRGTEVLLAQAIDARRKMTDWINGTIESATKVFCDSHNFDASNSGAFVERVEKLLKLFKEFDNGTDSELDKLKQIIPKRSSLLGMYLKNRQVHNFSYHRWEYTYDDYEEEEKKDGDEDAELIDVKPAPIQSDISQRKKSKSIPKVAVIKFYRVVLNFILMPVLKTFWPADINHPDYELYTLFVQRGTWQKRMLPLYCDLYYSRKFYVSFNNVTISSAHPSHWPLIAVGLAYQLLPLIIPAANDIMDGKSSMAVSVDKLIDALEQTCSLIPQNVKQFFKEIGKEKKE